MSDLVKQLIIDAEEISTHGGDRDSIAKCLRQAAHRIEELQEERDRLLKHTGLCRAHWETPMDKRSDNIGCPICLTNRIEELQRKLAASQGEVSFKDTRIEELEAVISSGFQNLSSRDVADVLIDNANLRDEIKELKSLLDLTDFMGLRNTFDGT